MGNLKPKSYTKTYLIASFLNNFDDFSRYIFGAFIEPEIANIFFLFLAQFTHSAIHTAKIDTVNFFSWEI